MTWLKKLWRFFRWLPPRELLMWTCESCGRIRPDKKISVYSFPIKELPGAVRNWRYCNDRLACRTIAYEKAGKGPFTVIRRVQAPKN